MRVTSRVLCLSLVSVLSSLGENAAAQGDRAEIGKVLVFFDSINLPEVADKPFVKIATGWWEQSGTDAPENTHIYGVLLNDEGKRFRVLTTDLDTLWFTKTKPGTPAHEAVAYSTAPLKQQAQVMLAEAKKMKGKKPDRPRSMSHPAKLHGLTTEAAVLGWICAKNRLPEWSTQLIGEVIDQDEDFLETVREEIGHVRMWRMIVAIGNAAISWKEHFERFQSHAKLFPDSSHNERVRKTITTLERMVAEEERWKRRKVPANPTRKDQIASLVFELRDQNGWQGGQPGACDIFADSRKEKSPAHQLLKLGFDAVPQLIDAMDDDTLTRQVGYVRDFYFSHHVLRVGDCALIILQAIARRSFFSGSYFHETPHHEGKVDTTKDRVKAWWKEVQRKGEKQVLIEATERGDEESPSLAQLLVEKYPDAALAPLRQGISKSEDDGVREYLVGLVGTVDRDEAVPLLEGYLENGGSLGVRLAAAVSLWTRRPKTRGRLVDAMLTEWKNLSEANDSIASFLALCGDVRGIEALARRPEWVTDDLLGVLADGEGDFWTQTLPNLEKPTAEWLAAVEKFAYECLEIQRGWYGSSGNCMNPQICDFAARLLAARWPDRYRFDDSQNRLMRDRQIRVLQNAWRARYGLEKLPALEPSKVEPLPSAKVLPLVAVLLRDPKDKEGQAARKELLAMGLGALAVVEQVIARERAASSKNKMKPPPRGLAELEALSRQMGAIVREVILVGDSAAIAPDLAKQLRAMQGKPMDAITARSVVIGFIKSPPKGVAGMEFRIERGAGDLGTQLRVRLSSGTTGNGVSCRVEVSADGGTLYSCLGGGTIDSYTDDDAFQDFEKELHKALTAFPCRVSLTGAVDMTFE